MFRPTNSFIAVARTFSTETDAEFVTHLSLNIKNVAHPPKGKKCCPYLRMVGGGGGKDMMPRRQLRVITGDNYSDLCCQENVMCCDVLTVICCMYTFRLYDFSKPALSYTLLSWVTNSL